MLQGPSLRESNPLSQSGIRHVRAVCLHCNATLAPAQREFCCPGCEAVFGLLRAAGLGKYYDLRGEQGTPVAETHAGRDLKWLDALERDLSEADAATRFSLDVQGLHCSACVWLLEELFRRCPSGLAIEVNPALGKLELVVEPRFALRSFVVEIESFGYLLGPSKKGVRPPSSGLLWRIGVCAALAMNAMLFAIAIYCGLGDGPIFRLFHTLSFVIGCASVLVGGSVFLRSAWNSIARRVLHLDVPIALGIVLAFAGSTYSFVFGRSSSSYFDTLNVFIVLMLTGRWLQERVIESNRRLLLACDGSDGLLTRRLEDNGTEVVSCKSVRAGDSLLIAPGDLVPVDAGLEDAEATCSLDWISGESTARAFLRGALVPAGAFNAGSSAV
ncbi:MAG: heavy metal translocating P-type ATPase metal-binding domain-containing protein, partial [Polyangiaceae bacterium]